MVHELKIAPEYFKDVRTGLKKFEIRKNDRDFKVGDRLFLKEWNNYHYTGKSINVVVTYITDYMQKSGYVVLGIENTSKPIYS